MPPPSRSSPTGRERRERTRLSVPQDCPTRFADTACCRSAGARMAAPVPRGEKVHLVDRHGRHERVAAHPPDRSGPAVGTQHHALDGAVGNAIETEDAHAFLVPVREGARVGEGPRRQWQLTLHFIQPHPGGCRAASGLRGDAYDAQVRALRPKQDAVRQQAVRDTAQPWLALRFRSHTR